ncbi:hypothetical protein PJ267_08125 [Arthrobacter sp. OVS8]|nr:hypothetical protein PJ267_08125 [Arthrobacter sp. OVS8]
MDHFLQSPPWAAFQRSLGRTVHQRSGPGWSFLAIEESNPAGSSFTHPTVRWPLPSPRSTTRWRH